MKAVVMADAQVWEDAQIVCGSIYVMLCLGYIFLRKWSREGVPLKKPKRGSVSHANISTVAFSSN